MRGKVIGIPGSPTCCQHVSYMHLLKSWRWGRGRLVCSKLESLMSASEATLCAPTRCSFCRLACLDVEEVKGPQESQSSCQDSSKRCSNVRKPCLEPQVVPQREEVRFVADPARRSTISCKCLWLKWHTFATRQRQQIVLLSLGGVPIESQVSATYRTL